jgi:predicted RNase H-like HicB family nuclease
MKTNPNDQAFPCLSTTVEDRNGLTKREYFAAMALQGFLADGDSPDEAAEWAVEAADYLIEALSKAEKGGPVMSTWQIPASVLEAEDNAALSRRLDAIEAELKALALRIDVLNQNILHCADVIDSNFGEIKHEQDL